MSVYRNVPEQPKEDARVLVYDALDRATTSSSAVTLFKLVSAPAAVGLFLAMVNGTAAAVGIVATFGAGLMTLRRPRERATLTIEDRKLSVRCGARRFDAALLADVLDVELDIKKIQRVHEGGSAVPAVRFINTTVGPELDTARIVIVTRSDRIVLSDNYVAHIDAVEWLGKIRVFLRNSGWSPKDERASLDEEEDDDSSVVA